MSELSTYRPIGEVATLLRLQPHVLRFWETKFKQVAPLKRSGGRRYYRREDVRLLFAIRDLLYVEGYTLRGAQKVLRARLSNLDSHASTAEAATTNPSALDFAARQNSNVEGSSPESSSRSAPDAYQSASDNNSIATSTRARLEGIVQELEQALINLNKPRAPSHSGED